MTEKAFDIPTRDKVMDHQHHVTHALRGWALESIQGTGRRVETGNEKLSILCTW